MARGALEPLTAAMDARARGQKVVETHLLRHEADILSSALDRDEWVYGPQGSKNTPVYACAALGRWSALGEMCKREAEQGLFGLELGAPSGFYYGGIIVAKMLALRELRRLGSTLAPAVARALRAMFAWDALVAFPAGRLRDRVLVADKVEESATPQWSQGLTVAVSGNRWTPHDRGPATSEDAHSEVLMLALDWSPRVGRGKMMKGSALASILGGAKYTASYPAERFGLDEAERECLRAVVTGSIDHARLASGWIFGCRPARLPDYPDPWHFRLRRTSEGVESVFSGPWPNPNKPARACTQVQADGAWLGLQPSRTKANPARGYRVELRDGQIVASSDQSNGEHSIPELGGELLWRVDIVGLDVTFTAGGAA